MRSISGQYHGLKSKAMLQYQIHMHVKGVLSVVRQHAAGIQSAPPEIDLLQSCWFWIAAL